jgi:hypothetical protein
MEGSCTAGILESGKRLVRFNIIMLNSDPLIDHDGLKALLNKNAKVSLAAATKSRPTTLSSCSKKQQAEKWPSF